MSTGRKKNGLLISGLFLLFAFSSTESQSARRMWNHKGATERILNSLFLYQQWFKGICGHYPLTMEGFQQPSKENKEQETCTNYQQIWQHWNSVVQTLAWPAPQFKDGWWQQMTYKSDGNTFEIHASHGYSLTDKTTIKSNGLHWDNPKPPPDDVPPSPRPCIPSRTHIGSCYSVVD